MRTIWQKHKVLLIAFGMVVCMTAALGAGIGVSRSLSEKDIGKAAASENGISDNMVVVKIPNIRDDALYKDVVTDEDIAKKVCKKYNLDYETVKVEDVTLEMRNYEEALWLLKSMGKQPLLNNNTNTDQAFQSLEGYICDIYAFSGGKDVIVKKCKEYGIQPETSKISDLTEEQLIEIGEEAFHTSDHGKE